MDQPRIGMEIGVVPGAEFRVIGLVQFKAKIPVFWQFLKQHVVLLTKLGKKLTLWETEMLILAFASQVFLSFRAL